MGSPCLVVDDNFEGIEGLRDPRRTVFMTRRSTKAIGGMGRQKARTLRRRRLAGGSPLWILLGAVLLTACPSGGAREALETARFEELQGNVEHARQLYESILAQGGDSPEAAEARARLEVLGR